MKAHLAIAATPEDGAIAGLAGAFDWGVARTGKVDGFKPIAAVALGASALPVGVPDGCCVRWLDGAHDGTAGAERVIAQDGDGLWRRAPWPVLDAVFELPPPETRQVLIVSTNSELGGSVAHHLGARGIEVAERPSLSIGDLRAATVVVMPAPGAPLPARAMAVLASRRVLVTTRCDPAFGLIPGIEWFPADDVVDLVHHAATAATQPAAFERARAFGALAAERHRASRVYGRLVADLELEAGSG